MNSKSVYQRCVDNYANFEAFEVQLIIEVPKVPKLKKRMTGRRSLMKRVVVGMGQFKKIFNVCHPDTRN